MNLISNLIAEKMINDVIDILDGFIVNVGIEFEIVTELNKDTNSILAECLDTLKQNYKKKFEMGEPIYITDIYKLLNKVKYVVDTKNVKIIENYE